MQNENQKNGFVLLTLIVLLICLSLLIVTGWVMLESFNFGVIGLPEERALASAQAGLESALKYLKTPLLENSDWRQPHGDYDPGRTLTGTFGDGNFSIVFCNCDKHHVIFRCTGSYGGCSRTVTRGVTRIAKGSNNVIYCGNTGGFVLGMSTWAAGDVYTNGPYQTQGPPFEGCGALKVMGKVYRRPNLFFNGRALEGCTTLSAARPAIVWNLAPYHNLRSSFHNMIAFGPWPTHNNRNWTGVIDLDAEDRSDVNPNDGNLYYDSLTVGPGNTSIDSRGRSINVIVSGNVTFSGTANLNITNGSHLNIIAQGNIVMANVSQFTDWDSNNPTYFYTEQEFRVTETGVKLNAPFVRILCNNFSFQQSSTFPEANDLTLYAFGPAPSRIVDAIVVNGVVILDDLACLYMQQAPPRIRGIVYSESNAVYPFRLGTMYFVNTSCKIEGSLISNSTVCCLDPANSIMISEGRVWRQPDLEVMPTDLGLNPMGTGGFSTWSED